MTKFNYKLFHKLFKDIRQFRGAISEDASPDEEDLTDHSGKDISACLKLSIFPQLKKITRWGENVDVADYYEIKEGEEIIGAKGIIRSCMDWCDMDEPNFYYEFAHLEKDGRVNEYVRELHIDDVIMKVLADLDKKLPLNSVPFPPKEKGSDEGRALIARAIKNCDDDDMTPKARIKYRCLVEGEEFEVWKVGFHQGPYQIFMAAPKVIGEPQDVMPFFIFI